MKKTSYTFTARGMSGLQPFEVI